MADRAAGAVGTLAGLAAISGSPTRRRQAAGRAIARRARVA